MSQTPLRIRLRARTATDAERLLQNDDHERKESQESASAGAWLTVPLAARTVADVIEKVASGSVLSFFLDRKYDSAQDRISLFLAGFMLPPNEPASLLRDGDLIDVQIERTKKRKWQRVSTVLSSRSSRSSSSSSSSGSSSSEFSESSDTEESSDSKETSETSESSDRSRKRGKAFGAELVTHARSVCQGTSRLKPENRIIQSPDESVQTASSPKGRIKDATSWKRRQRKKRQRERNESSSPAIVKHSPDCTDASNKAPSYDNYLNMSHDSHWNMPSTRREPHAQFDKLHNESHMIVSRAQAEGRTRERPAQADFATLPLLKGPPRRGDTIGWKTLELLNSTPTMLWKAGHVVRYDPVSDVVHFSIEDRGDAVQQSKRELLGELRLIARHT